MHSKQATQFKVTIERPAGATGPLNNLDMRLHPARAERFTERRRTLLPVAIMARLPRQLETAARPVPSHPGQESRRRLMMLRVLLTSSTTRLRARSTHAGCRDRRSPARTTAFRDLPSGGRRRRPRRHRSQSGRSRLPRERASQATVVNVEPYRWPAKVTVLVDNGTGGASGWRRWVRHDAERGRVRVFDNLVQYRATASRSSSRCCRATSKSR